MSPIGRFQGCRPSQKTLARAYGSSLHVTKALVAFQSAQIISPPN